MIKKLLLVCYLGICPILAMADDRPFVGVINNSDTQFGPNGINLQFVCNPMGSNIIQIGPQSAVEAEVCTSSNYPTMCVAKGLSHCQLMNTNNSQIMVAFDLTTTAPYTGDWEDPATAQLSNVVLTDAGRAAGLVSAVLLNPTSSSPYICVNGKNVSPCPEVAKRVIKVTHK